MIVRSALQVLAFLFPSPVSVWIHRLAGASIGERVRIHPCVLLLVERLQIGSGSVVKFGVKINARTLSVGRKCSIGFYTLVRGKTDLIMGDAGIIGPRCMLHCDRPIVLGYYCGVGPGSYLYTHGSGMPVTEGYRATFGPIRLVEKVWISMRCVIGPNVTIGRGTCLLPGTVLLESVGEGRIVAGTPGHMSNYPNLLKPLSPSGLADLGRRILSEYGEWCEHSGRRQRVEGNILHLGKGWRETRIGLDVESDITIWTAAGKRSGGAFLNLADLSTDEGRSAAKRRLESFLRMNYGLIFLDRREQGGGPSAPEGRG